MRSKLKFKRLSPKFYLMILFRSYIFRRFISTFFIVMPAIALSIWMVEALNQVKLIVQDGFSTLNYLKIVLARLAVTVDVSLPLAGFVATFFVLSRLHADQEINAVHAVGGSPVQFMFSALQIGLALSIPAFVMSLFVVPFSYERLEKFTQEGRNELFLSRIRPGKFNDIGKDVTAYIHSRQDTHMKSVLVADKRNPNVTSTVTSEAGEYRVEGDNILITFINGIREEYNHEKQQSDFLKFDNFDMNISELHQVSGKPRKRIRGASLFNLLFKDTWPRTDAVRELNRRLARGFLPITMLLIAFVTLTYSAVSDRVRSSTKRRVFVFCACITAVAIQIGFISFMNLHKNGGLSSEALYAAVIGPGFLVVTFVVLSFARHTSRYS